MNKIVKDALILFAITLVAGVLLGFVYDITKDPIAAQNEKAKQEAYKEVMADADSFEALSGDAYSEANITATFAAALQADAENIQQMKSQRLWQVSRTVRLSVLL